MRVKTLLVDVGGVLLSSNPAFWEMLQRDWGAPAHVEDLFYGPESPWPACRTGAIDYAEYMRRVADQLGMDSAVLTELRDRHEWVVNERMAQWVRDVHRGGLEVILVSNADTTLEERLQKFALDDAFDAVVNSARVGAAKPDPAIYRRALELTESAPPQCLFVDDRESNLIVARDLGLHAVLFGDLEQFLRDLRRLAPGEPWAER